MMARTKRLRVGVIFGGRSVEHDVSLVSAKAIIAALDPARYDVVPIAVTRAGRFALAGAKALFRDDAAIADLFRLAGGRGGGGGRKGALGRPLDVVFPIIHGTGGEDGSLQGLLTLAGVPFVGAGVLGSAVGMDKAVMKVLFRQAGLPIAPYQVAMQTEFDADEKAMVERLEAALGYPCFIKPANGGSSVGVSKARERRGLLAALRLAFRYDRKVLAEHAVDAREIECAVLGNERPEASIVGEIVPSREFYDYAAKYLDSRSRLMIPAPISEAQSEAVRDLAVRAFQVLEVEGLARVDFFLDRVSGALVVNEVNTLPGFTPISMYPKLWEASGLPFPRLVDRLIALALERHAQRLALVTAYSPRRAGGRRA
jgi:D-alanine-D-alanine ligase